MSNNQTESRTIKGLLSPECQVYIWISSAEALERFRKNACAEGFSFSQKSNSASFNCKHFLHISDDMTIDYPNYTGACGAIAFQCEKFKNGRLVVKVDYEKYMNGEADFFYGGQRNINVDDLIEESTDKYGISAGTAAILIREPGLQENSDFLSWLHTEGFRYWSYSKGWYPNTDWIYVNLNSKLIARGMPGIRVTQELGNHAVSIDEFKQIYNIFAKYDGLSPLQMK